MIGSAGLFRQMFTIWIARFTNFRMRKYLQDHGQQILRGRLQNLNYYKYKELHQIKHSAEGITVKILSVASLPCQARVSIDFYSIWYAAFVCGQSAMAKNLYYKNRW
jgi:hypothetical protein